MTTPSSKRDDERHRHQRTGIELEQIGGRIVDDRDAAAALGTADLDDRGADQMMHPQRVRVVDRFGVQARVGEPLGGRCDR